MRGEPGLVVRKQSDYAHSRDNMVEDYHQTAVVNCTVVESIRDQL